MRPSGTAYTYREIRQSDSCGGCFGVAPLYPIARELKAAGNDVISIIGVRSKGLLIYKAVMQQVCDKVLITTDDGSKGTKGVVTTALKQELEQNGADMVMAVRPAIMMKYISETTKFFGIKTIVSLNSIMIDGTGMCGGCRVSVGGKTRFACTDEHDLDGHQVDWDILINRQKTYL